MSNWICFIIIFLIVVFFIILITTAKFRMKRVYYKYMKITNSLNLTGKDFSFKAKELLQLNSLKFAMSKKELSDSYNSKTKTLILSENVCNNASLASLAIVAHELGHAIQDKDKNHLMKISQNFRKITKYTNLLIIPFILLSFLFLLFEQFDNSIAITFLYVSAILFVVFVFSNLLMIPLEFDASKIGMDILYQYANLQNNEYLCIKYLLKIATQTYIAYFFNEIITFGFKNKKY